VERGCPVMRRTEISGGRLSSNEVTEFSEGRLSSSEEDRIQWREAIQ